MPCSQPGEETLLATLSAACGAQYSSLTASRDGDGQACSKRFPSVTATSCRSSNAKVHFGGVQPHGFSLSMP